MSQQVMFTNTILKGINKGGTLKPDDDGYYTVVLGALGVKNSAGEEYVDTDLARRTFEANSTLMRRINGGLLRGEYAHPDPSDFPNAIAFEMRVRRIKEDRVCCHFHSVWLDDIDYMGKKVVGILGKVKPCGPYGKYLQDSLDNPKENVTFSGRYYSNVSTKNGIRHREIHTVATWDYVSEPGISYAQKYLSPSLEDRSTRIIFQESVQASIERESSSQELEMSMESSGYSAEQLYEDLGFKTTKQTTRSSRNIMEW